MTDTDVNGEKEACTGCKKSGLDQDHENLPGKTSINYRLGNHPIFLRHMLNQLPTQIIKGKTINGTDEPDKWPLARIFTGDSEDPTVALLDACAVVADVITFYQERIANEAFLRTATERQSVLELARSVGYELKPGVSASTYVVFTVDDTVDKGKTVEVPKGTKIQSIPPPDKLPQTFETMEDLEASKELNVLRPRRTEPAKLEIDGKDVILKGTNTGLKPGDYILFVGDERKNDQYNEHWDFRQVSAVTPDLDKGITRVEWKEGLGWRSPDRIRKILPSQENARCFALRQRAALFGYNAPDWRAMPEVVKDAYLASDTSIDKDEAVQWPGFDLLSLLSTSNNILKKGLHEEYFSREDYSGLLDYKPVSSFSTYKITKKFTRKIVKSARLTGLIKTYKGASNAEYKFSINAPENAKLWINSTLVINNSKNRKNSGSINLNPEKYYFITLKCHDNKGLDLIDLQWTPPNKKECPIPKSHLYSYNAFPVYLDASYPQILADSWLMMSIPGYQELYRVDSMVEDSQTNFTLSAKTTRVSLIGENMCLFNNRIRETAVYAVSDELEIADVPIDDVISDRTIELDSIVDGLSPGKVLVISEIDNEKGQSKSEMVELQEVKNPEERNTIESRTILTLKSPLLNSYKPDNMVIYANAVKVTHGETINEVLGSGDGSVTYQKFTLKNPPLTYISSKNGALSTLEVRVNDILWNESPSLYGKDEKSQNYMVRIDNDSNATITFGNGKQGARLPTGVENITATYRSGIGEDGQVETGTLTILQNRPIGIKEVTNPLPGTGAENPEKLEMARLNVPEEVLTMERIVSLQDFEDYARAFPGIGKAQAVSIWTGSMNVVCITIASAFSEPVEPDSTLFSDLSGSIDRVRDPVQEVWIKTYKPVFFDVEAFLRIDTAYKLDLVQESVKKSLIDAFSFDKRSFGQSVTEAEIVSVIQAVPGIIAAKLDKISVPDASQPSYDIETKTFAEAQLLLIKGIELKEMAKCTLR
ncbi:putative baseplate assembly protein [Methanosarcina sp. DH1]|uniref:putative baseplate assembly protein n=1 Tax=Methanosarcina sp. DH1 TaxID=2605695 RepID=UPI001E308980|nr:putative baseplate assembly protein [Methanosarcina sp. DH1]MCC4765503.1 putative baseplate assembly protein [Methanosarcina sp. DH1]